MRDYFLETGRDTLKGTIICGAREGYSGTKESSLEEALGVLDDINRGRRQIGLPVPTCMVSEATLIGRSLDEKYREKIYKFEFSLSPRAESINVPVYHSLLLEYVEELGSRLRQERVYLEFNGKTEAYKRNPSF